MRTHLTPSRPTPGRAVRVITLVLLASAPLAFVGLVARAADAKGVPGLRVSPRSARFAGGPLSAVVSQEITIRLFNAARHTQKLKIAITGAGASDFHILAVPSNSCTTPTLQLATGTGCSLGVQPTGVGKTGAKLTVTSGPPSQTVSMSVALSISPPATPSPGSL
jgi:hypothetical protein